jgi:DNA-binding MarR family transcriptional regulator
VTDEARTETVKAAKKWSAVLEEFRKLNPEIQAQQIAIFLAVVIKPDQSVNELAVATGQGNSSASRNIHALSKVHRKGMSGLGLLTAVEDELDRRLKRIRLTPKGVMVMNSLERLL